MRRRTLVASLAAVAVLAMLWIAFRNLGPSDRGSSTPIVVTPAPASPAGDQPVASDLPIDFETWQAMIAESDDLKGLMTAAMKIGNPDLRQAVVASIIDRWLLAEAAGFIKHLSALEVAGDKDSLAIVALALQESLTRLSVESTSSDEILVVVQRLISYLASTDPEKALEWARRFLLDDTLDSAVVSIARGMSRTDVEAALRIAETIQSPLRRSQAFAAVGTVWAAKDPTAALAWAGSLKNHSERALTVNSVLLVTANQNPPAAARSLSDQAKNINDVYLRERAAQLAAAGITEADLVNDPDTYRDMLESGAIPAPSSPDVELMATAGKVIGSKLAEADALNALAWAQSLDGDFLKLTSLSGVLGGWATTKPAAALAWVRENHPANADLHASVFRSWAAGDPAAAAAAAQQIEQPNQRAAILETVVKVWATQGDSSEATAFVNGLPPSASTDSASYALATTISYKQPDQAWQIAQGITNESAQFRALKTAFSVMVARDPGAAAVTLNASRLPQRTTDLLSGILSAATAELE